MGGRGLEENSGENRPAYYHFRKKYSIRKHELGQRAQQTGSNHIKNVLLLYDFVFQSGIHYLRSRKCSQLGGRFAAGAGRDGDNGALLSLHHPW